MSDNLNLHLWVARRAEQGTLQAQADYVVEQIKLLEQAVKYEADLAQQALDSRAELAAEVKKYHDAWLEAEAQVVELEAQVEGCLAVIATERAEVLALRRKLEEEREATWKLLETPYKLAFEVCQEKLAEAMEGFEGAMGVGMAYSDDRLGYDGAIYLLNRLKGEQDD